jgi:hypothetical protein
MEQAINSDLELQSFWKEIKATGWRAQLVRASSSTAVCLRIGPCTGVLNEPVGALEICRTTLARALESARRHIFQ